jgi:hypothetical protein
MVMVQIPSDIIVNQSKAIVRGKVESISYQKQNKVIYTYYTFRIYSDGYIKQGTVSSDTVTLKMVGGKVGHETLDVPGLPVLTQGAEYVLFLEKRGSKYDIYGANQGCLKVVKDASNTQMVVPCENRYFNSIYINQAGGETGSLKNVPLDDLVKKIKDYQTK